MVPNKRKATVDAAKIILYKKGVEDCNSPKGAPKSTKGKITVLGIAKQIPAIIRAYPLYLVNVVMLVFVFILFALGRQDRRGGYNI